MNKIICLISITSLVLVGCGNDLEKDNQSNIFEEKSQNVENNITHDDKVNDSPVEQIQKEDELNSIDIKKLNGMIGFDFDKNLLSKLKKNNIKINKSATDVYLVSFNEKVEKVTIDFAGGGLVEGENSYSGNYFLVAVKNNKLISLFSVPFNATYYTTYNSSYSNTYFCDNTPHNGIEKIIEPKTGKELILIKMYETSSTEIARFYDYVDDNF